MLIILIGSLNCSYQRKPMVWRIYSLNNTAEGWTRAVQAPQRQTSLAETFPSFETSLSTLTEAGPLHNPLLHSAAA